MNAVLPWTQEMLSTCSKTSEKSSAFSTLATHDIVNDVKS